MANGDNATEPVLEPATVYLLQDHQIILEELRLKLRRQGVKVSKSKLVRVAINLLSEQNIEKFINDLKLDNGE